MKTLLIIFILSHGFIHLFGYSQLLILIFLRPIRSIFYRVPWLLAALLFLASAILLIVNLNSWWIVCSLAILLSQLLIIFNWDEAKYGTIFNIFIIALSVISL